MFVKLKILLLFVFSLSATSAVAAGVCTEIMSMPSPAFTHTIDIGNVELSSGPSISKFGTVYKFHVRLPAAEWLRNCSNAKQLYFNFGSINSKQTANTDFYFLTILSDTGLPISPRSFNIQRGQTSSKISWNGNRLESKSIDLDFEITKKVGVKSESEIDLSKEFKLGYWITGDSQGNTMEMMLGTINFSGRLKIHALSCTTGDFNYDLGAYPASLFKGIGTTSAWRFTPITLTNCPVFFGSGISHNSLAPEFGPSSTSTPAATQIVQTKTGLVTSNEIHLKLTAQTAVFDQAKGIVEITGQHAATGVALQIGYLENGQYSPINLKNTVALSVTPGSSSGIVEFPFAARYIQTGDKVTAGEANAYLLYTVNYE